MTDLVLVRHGETVWHADDRYAGVSDVALTERGERQAARLAEWAGGADLAAVWCSDLDRARRTADPCAAAAGVEPVVDGRLRELDFGEAEGMTKGELAEEHPDALAAFRADPVADHLPGGEDPVACAQRFTACLDDVVAAHPDGRVLVVAHGTAIRLALCHALGLPLGDYRRVFPVVGNCSLTVLRRDGDDAGLVQWNAPLPGLASG